MTTASATAATFAAVVEQLLAQTRVLLEAGDLPAAARVLYLAGQALRQLETALAEGAE